ncbi:MAG: MBL fold metallo-hydrolase [Chloroflexi bacterium]|nr:MBL fold metallo-hydrolase [Chloroflexota bacterium]
MDIHWLGHACFRIRTADAVILTDPYAPSLGLTLPSVEARIVVSSNAHPHHQHLEGVAGKPYIVRSPGEYEMAGVFIRGFPTAPPLGDGPPLKNTAYLIEVEGITLCHLGDAGAVPNAKQLQELGEPDILLIPAGELCTMAVGEVAETVRRLSPKLAIPMHYQTPGVQVALAPLDKLLKEMGVREATPQPRLSLTRSALAGEAAPRLVVLAQTT